MDPLVVVFGLGVGVLIGMTGIGGGSLMTPLLVLVVGVPPTVAIGTDLAYGAVTKTLGGWRHLRQGTVDLGVSVWLAAGSVPGALVGVFALDRLHAAHGDAFDSVLLACVAGALLLVSVALLGSLLFGTSLVARERTSVHFTRGTKAAAVAVGAVIGVILGLTSVGSGALIGPALILLFHLTPHRTVGTDVFHAAILLWVAGSAHWVGGNIDFVLMGTILVGSLPGVWLGARLAPRLPATALRPVLACVLLGSALGVLTKAGVDLPVAAILGVPAAVGVAVAVLLRLRRPILVAA